MRWCQIELKDDCEKVICKYENKKRVFYDGHIEFKNYDQKEKKLEIFILIYEKDHFAYMFQSVGSVPCEIALDESNHILTIILKNVPYFEGEGEMEKGEEYLKHKYINETKGDAILTVYVNKDKWKSLIQLLLTVTKEVIFRFSTSKK